jgi:hypothetical protein
VRPAAGVQILVVLDVAKFQQEDPPHPHPPSVGNGISANNTSSALNSTLKSTWLGFFSSLPELQKIGSIFLILTFLWLPAGIKEVGGGGGFLQ